jgi:hypothetical protein
MSMLASVLLAYLFSNAVLRSLTRLSERIENIAMGSVATEQASLVKEGKEFADMQTKLDALSQQYRGAKEDVQQMRAGVERMLERLEEGVLLFDPEYRLLRSSRPAELLLGVEAEQLAGCRMNDLFPAGSLVSDLVGQVVTKRQAVHDAAVTLERPSAGRIRVLLNIELMEGFPDPGLTSLMLTLRDAETRRQLRSQLDISTRLTAISRLTGGVAHEIKNPLNAIALHLEILRAKLGGASDVQKELGVIGGEISRLDRVVKTFLDFTRPVEPAMREINAVELARQVASLVWPEASRVQVAVELDAPSPVEIIQGDEDLLKQALINLVNNGIDAMKEGGRLVIRVRREAGEVVVSVCDQGCGIAEELRDKIFQLYFSTKQKGSGIGLAMTFRIIQLHNATMDFVSKAGQGSTFFLRFPAVDDRAQQSDSTVAAPVRVGQ